METEIRERELIFIQYYMFRFRFNNGPVEFAFSES